MKYLIGCLCFLSQLVFAVAPDESTLGNTQPLQADNQVSHYGELYVVEDRVNLRSTPGLQGKIIRKANGGEVFFRLSNHHQDSYIRMKDSNGGEFWVHTDLVTPVLTKK